MKNLRATLVLISMFCISIGYGQLEKGNLLVGGNVGFNIQFYDGSNAVNLGLRPTLLSLITDNLAVGGSLGLNYYKSGSTSYTSVGILPAGRYYFPSDSDRMAFFADAYIGVQMSNSKFSGRSESESALAFGFGPGLAFFLSEDVSIDAGLNFNRLGGDLDRSNLNFVIGFQVFLLRGEKN